jgi:prephenate dehydrogenase
MIGKLVIQGVGLIGGSIGMAARARGVARSVVGLGRNQDTLDEAARLGAIDQGTIDATVAYSDADVIVICTPVTRIALDVIHAARLAPPGALITDAGSTKRRLVEEVEADLSARSRFVGSHPMAGSEQRGASAARADLFEGRVCVLTPTERTPADRVDRTEAFWRSLGCRTIRMDLASHDAGVARASHVPHAVAASVARIVPDEWLELGAGAFRDVTRVAGADPSLWSGIFLENRAELSVALSELTTEIDTLRAMLERCDTAAIEAWWTEARRRREQFVKIWNANGKSPSV